MLISSLLQKNPARNTFHFICRFSANYVDCVLICDKESVEVIEDKYAFNGQYNKEYYSRLN